MLLDAMADNRVQRSQLNAFQARQILSYHDANLSEKLRRIWGAVQEESTVDREQVLDKWRDRFSPEILGKANLEKGRSVFHSLCASCHTLNGNGGKIGPDLTGAARDNLNYLLDNLLFPSALVGDEYRLSTLFMKDGRILAGIIRARAGGTLRLQTMTDVVLVAVDDVEKEEIAPVSLMPPGLIESVPDEDARDLIAYLMAKEP